MADLLDAADVTGEAVELGADHEPGIGVHLKGLFQGHRVHIPGIVLRINKDGDAALVDHGI